MGSQSYRHHNLSALSGKVLDLAVLIAPFTGRYQVPQGPELDELVSNWSPDMRYDATGLISKSTAEKWLHASAEVYKTIVIKIILDGQTGA